MGEMLGFQVAWTVLAMINVAFFFPVLILFWKGEHWRERLGPPRFDQDLWSEDSWALLDFKTYFPVIFRFWSRQSLDRNDAICDSVE